MRAIIVLLALMAIAPARADIAPTPDAGPFAVSVAGLKFEIRDVKVKYPPGYTKTFQVAVLTGCVEGHVNCALVHDWDAIGMEVDAVNDEALQPEQGRLHMIEEAFKHASGEVKLRLYRRSGGDTATVNFAPR